MLRILLLLLAGIVGIVVAPGSARAAARVLVPPNESAGLSQVWLAVARGLEQTTVWLSLELRGPARRVLVVLPAPAGSALDAASEAWLSALDGCSAPRILAPYGELPLCGQQSSQRVHDTSALDATRALVPTQVSVLSSVQALSELAAARGYSFGDADRAALAGSSSMIAVEIEVPVGGGRTQSLRLVTPGATNALALGLLREVNGAPFTLFLIAGARSKFPAVVELGPEAIDPVWLASASSSDYPERRRARLQADDAASYVLEAAGSESLFNFRLLPDALATIEPAVSSYFARAATLDDVKRDSAECISAANEARTKKARVGRACAPGLLGRVGANACSETPIAGEIAPDVFRCDQAEDLALALSGLKVDEAFLTRFAGWIGPGSQAFQVSGTAERAPVVRAETLDATGCLPSGSGGSGGSGSPAGGSTGFGGFNGHGGFGGSVRPSDPVTEETSSSADIHCGCESTSSSDSCSGDSSGEDEGCSSDSSGEDDGCSSDSSGEGDGCSGDSSGEGDGCSGDGAGDGGGDCSGDSSGGGDCSGGSEGGGCSGDAGGGGGECSVTRSRPRPRLSALTLAIFSILLPIRRFTRRARS